MLLLDGSYGEGGGQILRTSLALSLVTGQPFRLENIRAGRSKPGLQPQHLMSVRAAGAMGQAEMTGAELRSQQLTFVPRTLQAGEHTFAIGTAGSTTLVLQTILPALLLANAPSRIVLEGGTHNEKAPPFDFIERTFVPLLNRMGASVSVRLERHGFYPVGGGRIVAAITPCRQLQTLSLLDRGATMHQQATVILANLPAHIADRELAVIGRLLGWPPERLRVQPALDAPGPGNAVLIETGSTAVTEVSSVVGRRGVPAEAVAKEAVQEHEAYVASGAAVGEHLADQLLLPLALAGGGAFTAAALSSHTTTNMHTISQFLPSIAWNTRPLLGKGWLVEVGHA